VRPTDVRLLDSAAQAAFDLASALPERQRGEVLADATLVGDDGSLLSHSVAGHVARLLLDLAEGGSNSELDVKRVLRVAATQFTKPDTDVHDVMENGFIEGLVNYASHRADFPSSPAVARILGSAPKALREAIESDLRPW